MGVDGGVAGVRSRRPVAVLTVTAMAVVVADQLAKAWALRALRGHAIHVVGSAVQLRLVRNTGSAFSLATGMAPLLAAVAVVLSIVVVAMGRRERDPWLVLALGLVLGGALGNLADRLFRDPGVLRGAVVDFIDLGPWPTFNIADAAITVGAVLLVWRGWRR